MGARRSMNDHKTTEGTPAPVTIATHNGIFHADEVYAMAILMLYHAFKGTEVDIVRTRDLDVIANADIAIDVGGEYNVAKNRYDHHQRGGARDPRPGSGTPYATAGLVWSHFGLAVVSNYIDEVKSEVVDLPTTNPQTVWETVDRLLIAPIDQADVDPKQTPRGSGLTVSRLTAMTNVPWFVQDGMNGEEMDAAFTEAVAAAIDVICVNLLSAIGEISAEGMVLDAASSAEDDILVLDRFMPWRETVMSTWACANVKFVVFPSPDGEWICQTVPKGPGIRESRIDLPESWAGLRDADFQIETHVQDAIFCHSGRFVCGAKSKEGAIQLAKYALDWKAALASWSVVTT